MNEKLIVFVIVTFMAQLASSATQFQQTFEDADILRDTISQSAMYYYLSNYNPKLTVACFEQQSNNFTEFGTTISIMLRSAGSAIGRDAEKDLGAKAKKLLTGMAATIQQLTKTFWPLMESGAYEQALEARQDAGDNIKESAKAYAEIIEKLREVNSKAAKDADRRMRRIHKEAKLRSRNMSYSIRDCIEAPRIRV